MKTLISPQRCWFAACLLVLYLSHLSTVWAASTPPFTLLVQGGRVSADIDRVPLGAVLAELAGQVPFQYSVGASEAARQITFHVESEPLIAAVRQLLREHNYVMVFDNRAENPTATALTSLRIVGSSTDALTTTGAIAAPPLTPLTVPDARPDDRAPNPVSSQLQPDPQAVGDFDEQIADWQHEAIRDPDITRRRAALSELETYLERPEVIRTVMEALADPEPSIRKMALDVLEGQHLETVFNAIGEMFHNDLVPTLRIGSLEVLVDAEAPGAPDLVQLALRDPDPSVRRVAQHIIDQQN